MFGFKVAKDCLRYACLASCTLTAAFSQNPAPSGATGPPIVPSPNAILMGPSGLAKTTIAVNPSAGFAGPVSFTAAGLPAGGTATFDPPTVLGSGTTTLSITTPSTSATGSFLMFVTARSATSSFTAQIQLTVAQPWHATLLSPIIGSFLTAGSTVKFTWDAGRGVTQYRLNVGKGFDGSEYYAGEPTSDRTATVTLPQWPVFFVTATLSSLISGTWQPQYYQLGIVGAAGDAPVASISEGKSSSPAFMTYVLNDGTPAIRSLCANAEDGSCTALAGLIDSGSLVVSGTGVSARLSGFQGRGDFEVTFTADATAAPGPRSLTLTAGKRTLTLDNAITVYDGKPVIANVQQYPYAADGSYYEILNGTNFGPAPGAVSVCFKDPTGDRDGTNPCAGEGVVAVCMSPSCGAVYAYWSDTQVNVLLIPTRGATGVFDIFLTSGGESPELGFVAAPGAPSGVRRSARRITVAP